MESAVVVATFRYRHEAEFAHGLLENRGIASAVEVDDAGGSYAGLSLSSSARLRVRAEDRERAKTALVDAGLLEDDSARDEDVK